MAEKKLDAETLEGVVVESVGDGGDGATFTVVVAVPEAPPPPVNPDDAVKAACERAAGGGTVGVGGGREGEHETSPRNDGRASWLAQLAEADARLSAAASAADAEVKRRIDSSSPSKIH